MDASPKRTALLDVVLSGAGVFLFGMMLYEMRGGARAVSFPGPLVLGLAGGAVLWPLRAHRGVRTLLGVGAVLLVFWLVAVLRGTLAPFVVTYVLAYLLAPLVAKLERRGVPRWVSALGLTLAVIGAFTAILLLVVPAIAGEVQTLAGRLVSGMGRLRTWVESTALLDRVAATGLVDKRVLIDQVTASSQAALSAVVESIPRSAQRVAASVGAILRIVTTLSLVPVILFYLLKDFPAIAAGLVGVLPTVGGQRAYLVRIETVVGGYLRGQLIISAIGAVNAGFWLTLFGVPFSFLLGILTGLLNLIPNLGALLTMVIGVVVALIFGDPVLKDVLVVVVVLLGQGQLEGLVLSPMILSQQVGLHPVLILMALFVFGYFLGFVGFLVAVPVTALLSTYYNDYRHRAVLDLRPSVHPDVDPGLVR